MDFIIPKDLAEEVRLFDTFLRQKVRPELTAWYEKGEIPRSLHVAMGEKGWLGFEFKKTV